MVLLHNLFTVFKCPTSIRYIIFYAQQIQLSPLGFQYNCTLQCICQWHNIATHSATSRGGELELTFIRPAQGVVGTISAREGLRSAMDTTHLKTPLTHKTVGDRSFSCFGSELWNSLPLSIRSYPTVDAFKRALKTYLF